MEYLNPGGSVKDRIALRMLTEAEKDCTIVPGRTTIVEATAGTTGTVTGTGKFLKDKKTGLRVIGADPEGSIPSGDAPRSYKVEGIGEDFFPENYDKSVVDEWFRVSDAESFAAARRLAREEGLPVGGSSGTALAAALKYAEKYRRPETIVVMFPDTGRNYLSTIFDDAWMKENGFL